MRFPFYNLRTGILTHIVFLIVFSMLLIHVVMIKLSERDLIRVKMQTGRLLLNTVAQEVGYEMANRNKMDLAHELMTHFKNRIVTSLRIGGFSDVLVVNREGSTVFALKSSGEIEKECLLISNNTLETGDVSCHFHGRTWSVFWPVPKWIIMSSPVTFKGHVVGATTICADLGPLYQGLRDSEKIILLYILLNTLILGLLGVYLLSRTVVRPIHKLLRITEEFEGGEPFPQLTDSSRNEIGQLYRSLNNMLKRLEENKQDLKDHISSLETANQELNKAQKEIIKSEKLASIGRLAAGVAHEIGNPIGIILGYLELLNRGDLDAEERQDFLGRIESEIARVNQIIRQLLDLSRPVSVKHEKTSVHRLITETLNMLKPQPMMESVRIKSVFEAERDTVWADNNQLKQVLLNVIMNAADAMDDAPLSENETVLKSLIIKTINLENSIELRFQDTGSGILEQDIAKIFDPFYTTKAPGKGTGLGLSVCYSIIEGLGGTIQAESTPGKGTTIIIDIPLFQMKN